MEQVTETGMKETELRCIFESFGLQSKPFITIADALEDIKEYLNAEWKKQNDNEPFGAADFCVIRHPPNENHMYHWILGYDQEKIQRALTEKTTFLDVDGINSIYDALQEHKKYAIGPTSEDSLESRCKKKLEDLKKQSTWSNQEKIAFLTAIFQLIYSHGTALGFVPGWVKQFFDVHRGEDVCFVKLLAAENTEDDPGQLAIYNMQGVPFGEEKDQIDADRKNEYKHNNFYKWVNLIQNNVGNRSELWLIYWRLYDIEKCTGSPRGLVGIQCYLDNNTHKPDIDQVKALAQHVKSHYDWISQVLLRAYRLGTIENIVEAYTLEGNGREAKSPVNYFCDQLWHLAPWEECSTSPSDNSGGNLVDLIIQNEGEIKSIEYRLPIQALVSLRNEWAQDWLESLGGDPLPVYTLKSSVVSDAQQAAILRSVRDAGMDAARLWDAIYRKYRQSQLSQQNVNNLVQNAKALAKDLLLIRDAPEINQLASICSAINVLGETQLSDWVRSPYGLSCEAAIIAPPPPAAIPRVLQDFPKLLGKIVKDAMKSNGDKAEDNDVKEFVKKKYNERCIQEMLAIYLQPYGEIRMEKVPPSLRHLGERSYLRIDLGLSNYCAVIEIKFITSKKIHENIIQSLLRQIDLYKSIDGLKSLFLFVFSAEGIDISSQDYKDKKRRLEKEVWNDIGRNVHVFMIGSGPVV